LNIELWIGCPHTRFAAPAGQGSWWRVDADGDIGVPELDSEISIDHSKFRICASFMALM